MLTNSYPSVSIASMLKIRLQRVGRKHVPVFRLVLTNSKNSTKSGKFLEVLGSHDPRNDKNTLFKNDRIKHWLKEGAKASGTVHNLLVHNKVIEGKKINKLPKKTPLKKAETVEAPKA
jgi:small subunit ribosomal protein S16